MPRRSMTREEVLEAIRTRHARGEAVVGLSLALPKLYHAARVAFGSWREAVLAAGVPVNVPRKWTRERVLEAIRLRHRQGPPLAKVWQDDMGLLDAATKHFGSWRKALLAAGLQAAPRQRWSRETILESLRAHYNRGHTAVHLIDPKLSAAVTRFFGNLDNAYEAAGLPHRPGRWSKRRIVDTIQDYYVRGKPIQFVGFKDKRLAAAANRYFGSWREAVTAAGLLDRMPPPLIPHRWSRQAVIDAIQDWHRQGVPVTSLWARDMNLYSAGKVQFGSWRNAVLAAGYEPGLRAWTRQLVVQEIQSLHEQGRPLTTTAAFCEASALAGAATRLFGSWKKALQAAGIRVAPPKPSCRPARNRRSA